MAQNRKASDEEVRDALHAAIDAAAEQLHDAADAYAANRSLRTLRAVQVASDRLKTAREQLRAFDDARSVDAVRHADTHPRRSTHAWPVGRPYDEPRKRSSRPPAPPKETPPLPPPCTRTPPVLAARQDGTSWWVGADRATLAAGARALQELPQATTAVVPSKRTIRRETQKQNEAKRAEKASRTLMETLTPMAGEFNVIPKAE